VQPARALALEIDPVRFEVIRNALLAITEEMGATLRRAAYSTNIKTRGDFSSRSSTASCAPLPRPSPSPRTWAPWRTSCPAPSALTAPSA
jgi:hypothetical protein